MLAMSLPRSCEPSFQHYFKTPLPHSLSCMEMLHWETSRPSPLTSHFQMQVSMTGLLPSRCPILTFLTLQSTNGQEERMKKLGQREQGGFNKKVQACMSKVHQMAIMMEEQDHHPTATRTPQIKLVSLLLLGPQVPQEANQCLKHQGLGIPGENLGQGCMRLVQLTTIPLFQHLWDHKVQRVSPQMHLHMTSKIMWQGFLCMKG